MIIWGMGSAAKTQRQREGQAPAKKDTEPQDGQENSFNTLEAALQSSLIVHSDGAGSEKVPDSLDALFANAGNYLFYHERE